MSLINQAVLIAVRRMIENRTWAGNRILEQPIDPIADLLAPGEGQGMPILAVYIEKTQGKPVGRQLQGGPQSVDLKICIYVPPSRMEAPGGLEFVIDNTGASKALNFIARQVDAAFHYGNAEWIALFRKLVTGMEDKTTRFVLIEVENGEVGNAGRIPSLEISYALKAVEDAEFGKPLYGAWLELDRLLRQTGEGADLADLIRGMIETPGDLPGYARFQANYGLSQGDMIAIGLAPLVVNPDGSVPILNDVDFPIDPRIVPPEQIP